MWVVWSEAFPADTFVVQSECTEKQKKAALWIHQHHFEQRCHTDYFNIPLNSQWWDSSHTLQKAQRKHTIDATDQFLHVGSRGLNAAAHPIVLGNNLQTFFQPKRWN